MKKLALVGGVIGLGIGTLLVLHAPTHAADHFDAPSIVTNPMADITDVYAWMSTDAKQVNLVMDVSPGDPGTMGSGALAPRHFGPSILYVFHVSSMAKYPPTTPPPETKVICRFNSDTDAECWVGDKDYVHGDPSSPNGVTSQSKLVKLFAGRRSDPFFFNFNGFADTVAQVDAAEGASGSGLASLDMDGDGCPELLPGSVGSALRASLQEGPTGNNAHPPCNGTDQDCFLHFDVQSIVLQIDKTLLNTGANSILGVWASTNMP